MEYADLREQVAEFARRMHAAGMVIGTAGNVSARIAGEARIAITPSSLPYPEMSAEDIQVLDLDGNQLTEGRPASLERAVHLAIYRARPEIGAVFHTHAVYSSVLAALRRPLPPIIDELVPYVGGQVEVAAYAMSASDSLAQNVVRALGDRSAVLIANHGNVCCGPDLPHAYRVAELLERVAQIYVLASMVGSPVRLPDEVVETERQMYETTRRWS